MYALKKMKRLAGEIRVPGDKSISHRAVMLSSLAGGETVITGFLNGADTLSTISCFENLGVSFSREADRVVVRSDGVLRKYDGVLYTGNSGTTTRLLCGILAGQDFASVLKGDESVCRRPMGRVTKPLSMMGAKIDGERCPLYISASKLHGISYDMPVASAQVKSALLLAGLFADGTTTVTEPYKSRNHTEIMLSAMGADISEDGLSVSITAKNRLHAVDVDVCGDISSAAYFIAAASVMPGSEVLLRNVGVNPTRTGIIDAARSMGADIREENLRDRNGEIVCDLLVKSAPLHGVRIGGEIIPRLIDELPVIAVMAAAAEGRTEICDAGELRVKETDRIAAVCGELGKCGVDICATEDGMIINGAKTISGADFESHGDHRMAMSLAVLAQLADGVCRIDDVDAVDISYPGFFKDFYALEDK